MSKKYYLFSALFIAALFIFSNSAFPQASRNILFEEFTNCCCGPCATYGPILDAFLEAHPSNTICVKYHTHGPGPDPMFWEDSAQIRLRYSSYYHIYYVPTCNIDAAFQFTGPFVTEDFANYYNQRLAVSTPLSITVTDVRVAGDSIKATVILNLASNLTSGNYKLRVMAVERLIHYASPPGSNGENEFAYCYRKAFPDVNGVSVPTTAGTHSYIYTYKRQSDWVDTSIFTEAFLQNDNDSSIVNSGRGHYAPLGINHNGANIPAKYNLNQNYPNPFNPSTVISFDIPKSGNARLIIYDVLGTVVYRLVDGYLFAGSYKYDFNASGITSGVYFYKLSTDNFTETKRMVVIK